MATTPVDRLGHIQQRIDLIRSLWDGVDYESAIVDQTRWAAFERHLDVISEASRNIPPDWKANHADVIPWDKVAGLGSLLRHVYQHVSGPILWSIYEHDLDELEAAINAIMATAAKPPRSPSS